MSCSSPFKIEISAPPVTSITWTNTTDILETSSYGGLTSPAHYIEWPVVYYCGPDHWWDYLDPGDYCTYYERIEDWPEITWIPSSSITYGISFNDTIECYGELISNGRTGGLGLISSWIMRDLTATLKGDIAGEPFILLNNTYLVPEIEFTGRLTGDDVQLFAEIPLYSAPGLDLDLDVFSVTLTLSFDILLCVLPSSSIKLVVDLDIGISALGSKSLDIDPSIAIPLITAGPEDSILMTYLSKFI